MRYFPIILFLFCISAGLVSAQDNSTQTQARIWYRALQWIYEDNNKTLPKNKQKPLPKVSSASVAQFEKDLAAAAKIKQDEQNFYTRLYQPVQEMLRKNQPVSDAALINAIVAEAAKKPDRKVEYLRLELEKVASQNSATAQQIAPPEKPEEMPAADNNLPTQEPENTQVPSATTSEVKTVKEEPNMLFNVISIAALLLAALAFYRSSRKSSRAVAPARTSEGYANTMGKPVQNNAGNQHITTLKKEIETLKKAYNKLQKENESWRIEIQDAIRDLQTSTYVAPPVSEKYDVYTDHQVLEKQPEISSATTEFAVNADHLFTEENESQLPPQNQVKYTRVPEDGQIKDREMHQDSRDTWSFIEVSIPDSQSNSATFRINPYINHARAINNSLDRLETAFEFARSANKATQIVNVADGELTRTAQGWQITKRAKIHLA